MMTTAPALVEQARQIRRRVVDWARRWDWARQQALADRAARPPLADAWLQVEWGRVWAEQAWQTLCVTVSLADGRACPGPLRTALRLQTPELGPTPYDEHGHLARVALTNLMAYGLALAKAGWVKEEGHDGADH
jgi:hypothetical protein